RPRRQPKPTAWQKFLSTITFGLLGKPKKNGGKRKRAKKPEAQTSRPVRNNAMKDKPAQSKKKRNRTEVTSGRLYVGNLSYETSEIELEELFRGIGNVISAEVVTNARTQQSKGFAFVEMGSIDEAKRAVQVLDDQEFMGRKLIISGARSEGPRENEDNPSVAESIDEASSAPEPELAETSSENES
ncbi:MAG: RNA-binding protein, partial [Verrucomicrobiota bacterium]